MRRKAIVIGATSGIGRKLAVLLADKDYLVGATGRRKEHLEELLSFILIYFLNVPFPFIILGTIVVAVAVLKLFPGVLQQDKNRRQYKQDTCR